MAPGVAVMFEKVITTSVMTSSVVR
jgi:hypothetical protein